MSSKEIQSEFGLLTPSVGNLKAVMGTFMVINTFLSSNLNPVQRSDASVWDSNLNKEFSWCQMMTLFTIGPNTLHPLPLTFFSSWS